MNSKSKTVDLNADMGEGGAQDAQIMPYLGSANIACGFHAGSADLMRRTIRLAQDCGVKIGAHPGFDDRINFGRKRQNLSHDELRILIADQLNAIQMIADDEGAKLEHFKLHGALANMCAEDEDMARICFQAALDIDPELTIFAIAGTKQILAAEALGCSYAAEIFADRAYDDDALLVDRAVEGAVIDDVDEILARIRDMIDEQAIISINQKRIPTKIDTVCIHSDTNNALQIAKSLCAFFGEIG